MGPDFTASRRATENWHRGHCRVGGHWGRFLAWIIHERVATVVPERARRVVFGGVGDAVIEV